MNTKTCSKCKQELPVTEFYKNKSSKDGLYGSCKKCHCERTRAWSSKNPEKMNGYAAKWRDENRGKINEAAKERYYELRDSDPEFMEKARKRSNESRRKDPVAYRQYQKQQRQKHTERNRSIFAEWYVKNSGKVKQKTRQYAIDNRERMRPINAQRTMRRYAFRIKATPSWADRDAINSIYRQAAELTESTGVKHHVDHYYPLRGKMVCGLHVENNLIVITAKQNQEKGNKMPC